MFVQMRKSARLTNTHTLFAGTCEVKRSISKAKMATQLFLMKPMTSWWRLDTLCPKCTVVSCNVNPIEGAVVTFVIFQYGTTNNVITDTAFLHGTLFALTQDMSLFWCKRVKTVAEGVAAAFLIWKSEWNSNKVDTYLLRNPALARVNRWTFDTKDGIELIDIENLL